MLSALIDFVDAGPGGSRLRYAFASPREVFVATRHEEVADVLDAAHARARDGAWCVGYVRYEAARAFDPALATHEADGPLAWFAVFDAPQPWPELPNADHAPMAWRSALERDIFDARIDRIHRAIADGEVYQINLTAPVTAAFRGSPLGLFDALHRAQPRAYAAFIDTGGEQVLSVSPELFFDWRDGMLLARPMKGTAPRGATPEDDARNAQRMLDSEKERAENLMIVDLIRNDLSRVAQPHSVQVPRLFHAQAWPTVWQMSSDVTARARAGLRLSQLFRALFPCGSITGAPKVQAMRWIQRLEDGPRGVYCGAIGVLQPGGAATFNVAIRSVVLRGDEARCGIGSGITIDAQAEGEWREWQHKQRFLERAAQPFELLQTLRLQDGRFVSLQAHLLRLSRSAGHFGFAWNAERAQQALQAVAAAHAHGAWRVRLRVRADGEPAIDAAPFEATTGPMRVALAASPIAGDSEFVRFKTTRRGHYEAFASRSPDVADTLLWNERGELTEFTRGNVAVHLDGRWVTPPLSCGLLDGVGRAVALEEGRLVEQPVRMEDLPRATGLAFVNSLRGWIDARLVGRA